MQPRTYLGVKVMVFFQDSLQLRFLECQFWWQLGSCESEVSRCQERRATSEFSCSALCVWKCDLHISDNFCEILVKILCRFCSGRLHSLHFIAPACKR